ncbi:MAG TPA: glycosyltransferase family 39 protein, partial [Gemmatimonadales bacterium]|nr:glycosyltransferase family 39 protein [Gemmatimonadales bacterium]
MERSKTTAFLLLVVAVLLPPHWTAAALAGSSPHLASVQIGVWIFKATLALHAVILALASRLPLGTDGPSAESLPAIPSSGSRMVLAGLLIIGLALRLHDLGVGLWFDEIQTMVDYVRLPLGQILTTYDSQNQHMLYSVLARLSVDLFGDSGWSLRLPAALMGTASLWATYRLASRLTSEREALLATLLLTFSYHHVWFSQNA